jgi:hypothetical protein
MIQIDERSLKYIQELDKAISEKMVVQYKCDPTRQSDRRTVKSILTEADGLWH